MIKLTDSTGAAAASYSYNPYSEPTASSGSMASVNNYRYASGYTDGTGLIKFGARYNPTLARFTQPDPCGQETNAYTYTGDNPISRSDPSRLGFWGNVGAAIGGAAVAFVGAAACVGTGGLGCIAAGAVIGASLTTAGGLIGSGFQTRKSLAKTGGYGPGGGALTGAAGGAVAIVFGG